MANPMAPPVAPASAQPTRLRRQAERGDAGAAEALLEKSQATPRVAWNTALKARGEREGARSVNGKGGRGGGNGVRSMGSKGVGGGGGGRVEEGVAGGGGGGGEGWEGGGRWGVEVGEGRGAITSMEYDCNSSGALRAPI